MMTEITDFNFTAADFTAADLAKFELIKSKKEEDLNNLAELLNQIVAEKVAKLCQEKDEFYGKQLASKELELDIFYKHFPCGYFSTTENGIITKINDALLVWLGYAKEDIIGKVTWQSLLSASSKIYFETHYSPLLQMQGFVQGISFEMVKKDKTRLPILINTKQIRDENGKVQINYSTVFDVSPRKSYEKDLPIVKRNIEEQNKLIEYTFKNASVPIYYVWEDASIFNFNDIGAENLGYTSEEFHTLKFYDLYENYDEKKWASLWAKLKAEKKITIETQQKKKDGTLVDVIIAASYVKYGDLELNCSYVLDATEKKKQEEQLKLLDYSFRNTGTAMALILEDGSFLDFNIATTNMLGYPLEEFKGITIMDINPIITKEYWAKRWSDLTVNPNQIIYSKFKKKDATLIEVEMKTSVITLGDITVNYSSFTDITEKKKQEEKLRLLDYFYKHTDSAIFFLDKNGLYLDYNQATANMLGYSYKEFRGKTVMNVNPMVTKANWAKRWENLKEISNQNFEVKLERKDGTLIDVAVNANSIKLNGDLVNFGFYRDITEKKKATEELKLMDFAFKKSSTPIMLLLPTGKFYSFNDALLTLLGYTHEEFSEMNLLDVATNMDEASCIKQWDEIREKQSVVFECHFERKDGILLDVEVSSNIINYNENEINFCYIKNITEKLALERNLKLVDFSFRNAGLAMHFWRKDGTSFEYNEADANLFGYKMEEFKNVTVFDLSLKHTPESWDKRFEEFRKFPNIPQISLLRKKDNSLVYVEVRSSIIVFEDLELCFSTSIDVTEKLALEKNLKIVDFSFRNARIAMHYWRKDGTIYDFNEAATELLGYLPEEYRNLNIVGVSNRHTPDSWSKRFEELKNGPNKPYITQLIRKDKSLVYVEIRSEIIVYEDVELCFSSFTDVTEKLEAEKELLDINQRYEYATLATSDVIWEADILKKEVFISKNFTAIFGHPVSEGWTPMENNIWRQNIHPDEADDVIKSQYEALNNETIITNWKGEYRLRKSDGTYAIVLDRTFGIRNEQGEIIKVVGAMQDITKQRAEEERLRLMESVILNTNDAVLITEALPFDEPGPRILFANKAFTKMTGYSQEELIGKTPRILQNEDTDRKELDKFRKALEKWETSDITLLNSKKNGEKYWVNLRTSPLANENGSFTHWISVERDITKEKEDTLEKEKLLKELVETNLELKQFSYITSHNLRAPLTNLVSICNIIKPEPGTDALTLQLIDAFKISTQHLDETLNDLIEVLIIKENRNIKKDQLTFEEIFQKIKESLSISLLKQKVMINADFSAAPAVTFANEYLESIFSNLISNAVKYRHPDRVPIITIKSCKKPNGDTKLTFADNGIGINMAYAKDKIFGLYKRFHKNADGKGIGLYLIHSQITALGGKIEVESEVNIGTTFTITFK